MTFKHKHIFENAVCVFVAMLTALSLASCRAAREAAHTTALHADTLREYRLRADTFLLHDSIFVHQYAKGDTVFLTKTVTRLRYRDRLVRDTVYRARTDTATRTLRVVKATGQRLLTGHTAAALAAASLAAVLAFIAGRRSKG